MMKNERNRSDGQMIVHDLSCELNGAVLLVDVDQIVGCEAAQIVDALCIFKIYFRIQCI